MKELGYRNWSVMVEAIKEGGSYAPEEVLGRCGEQILVCEYEEIERFLQWVENGKSEGEERRLGHKNYEERFKAFKIYDAQEGSR